MSLPMGAAARQLRHTPTRLVERATRRARLTVVPRRRVQAPRVPFVTLVSVILVGGVVGLLCFNTQMQQASFTASTLEDRAATLGARQQTLEMEVERLNSPNQVMAAAQRVGLVGPPGSPAQLWLATGKVTGVPSAASADAAPPLFGRAPGKPAEINPPPTVVTVPHPGPAPDTAAAAAAPAAQ